MAYFLGVDIGTYESKGTLIDPDGRVIASLAVGHTMEMPQPGWYEHDAEAVWWGDFCKLSQGLLEKSGVSAAEIAGVGASALGADCVPVDRDCRALRKAILYGIDSRATEEIAFLNEYFGREKILSMRDTLFNSEDVIARMLWLKNHEPDVYRRAYRLCTGSTYITAKLTGEYVVDRFLARTCFFPISRPDGSLDRELIDPLLAADKMASCRATTEVVGGVTAEAAAQTGLMQGTPVITGTDDAGAEALSVGVLAPGDVMVMLGSSMYMICVVDQGCHDPRLWHSGYLTPDTETIQGATNNAGTVTRWLRDQLFGDLLEKERAGGENAYAQMMELGRHVPPGSEGLLMLPYLAGERTPLNDPDATGMLLGLSLRHTRAHLYRAALEGVGYSVAQHFDILRENNVPLRNVIAIGGGTKNPLWMQIIADIVGEAVQTSAVTLGASYGDALLAAVGTGAIAGFGALRKVFRRERVYRPDEATHALYQPYYRQFRELYPLNRDAMHALRRSLFSPLQSPAF